MKKIIRLKRNLVSAGALLAVGMATAGLPPTDGDSQWTAAEIVHKSAAVYAALSSYSDQGTETATISDATGGSNPTTVAPHHFTIKLARPDRYRIEWLQDMGFYAQTGLVWSAGAGDFLKMGNSPAEKLNRESALSGATGISGGAAASLPGTFFKLNWGNQLGLSRAAATRKKDEQVNGVDCYVLTQTNGGRTGTLWIGKQDLLIRQIENDTSAAAFKAMMEKMAKQDPEIRQPETVSSIKSIETHTDIVINHKYTDRDFDPTVPGR